jgi:hypothetical protein
MYLLVAAMNEMLNDAKQNIKSPQELTQKEIKIRTQIPIEFSKIIRK